MSSRSVLADPAKRAVLLTCCLALFVSTLDTTVVNVALPSIRTDLGASTKQLQWIIDAYIVVRGALLLSAGALGDRIGRRLLFQGGLALFAFGSLLCSLAPTPDALIAARVLQAIGGCCLVPSSLALITETYREPGERARAIGIWSATTGASTGMGPLIGGVLVSVLGWRSVFWVNLPIAAAAIVMAWRFVPESRERRRRRVDVPGQVLIFVVLLSLTSGLIEASGGDWGATDVIVLLTVAVLGLVAFVIVEFRQPEPLLSPEYFRSPPFSGAALVALFAFVVYAGFLFINTLYLQEDRGFSPVEAGLLVMPTTIGNVLLAPLSGRLTASRGPRLPVALSGISMFLGAALLSQIGGDTAIPPLLVGYLLIGAGVGLVNAPITNAAVAGMPGDRAGVAGAITSTFRQVGNALGVALLGTLTFTSGLSSAYVAAAIFSLVSLAIGLAAFSRRGTARAEALEHG